MTKDQLEALKNYIKAVVEDNKPHADLHERMALHEAEKELDAQFCPEDR